MDFEKIWYESSPYLYGLAGCIALLAIDGPFAKACGLILLLAAGLIIQMRWAFRSKESRARAKSGSRKTAGIGPR